MAAEELTIAMRLRGARAANAQLRETAGSVDAISAAQRRSNRASARFARGLSAAGSSMTRHFTLPIVAGLGFGAKAAVDFDEKMRMVQTQAGASAAEVAKLKPAVLDFASSGQTVFKPGELADALFFIESHGFRGAAALRQLKAASDFATVGHANLAEATRALAAAEKSKIAGTESDVKTTRALNAIIGQGSLRMDDLIGALGTGLLPRARQVGLSLTDVGAGLDLLSRSGTPAHAAATRLAMTFARLVGGTPTVEKALNKIGLTGLRLGHDMRKKNGLLVAVQDLHDHLEKVKDPVRASQLLLQAFGGGRMAGGIMQLVQNTGELRNIYGGLNKQQGAYAKSLAAAKAEPANRLRAAFVQLQTAGIKLGAAVIPLIMKLAGGISAVAAALSGHPKVGLSLLAALAVMGPLLKLGSGVFKLYKAFVMLRNATFAATVVEWGFNSAMLATVATFILPVLAIGAIIGALVLLEVKFHLISRAARAVGHGIASAFHAVVRGIKSAVMAIPRFVKRMWNALPGPVRTALKWGTGPGLLVQGARHFFADGGHVATRTTAVVGERGPEIVSLPAGARVHPNEGGGNFATVPIVLTVDGRTLHEAVYKVERNRKARR